MDEEQKVLDYSSLELEPRQRRDSLAYYREPPLLAQTKVRFIVLWLVSFGTLGFGFVWVVWSLRGLFGYR